MSDQTETLEIPEGGIENLIEAELISYAGKDYRDCAAGWRQLADLEIEYMNACREAQKPDGEELGWKTRDEWIQRIQTLVEWRTLQRINSSYDDEWPDGQGNLPAIPGGVEYDGPNKPKEWQKTYSFWDAACLMADLDPSLDAQELRITLIDKAFDEAIEQRRVLREHIVQDAERKANRLEDAQARLLHTTEVPLIQKYRGKELQPMQPDDVVAFENGVEQNLDYAAHMTGRAEEVMNWELFRLIDWSAYRESFRGSAAIEKLFIENEHFTSTLSGDTTIDQIRRMLADMFREAAAEAIVDAEKDQAVLDKLGPVQREVE